MALPHADDPVLSIVTTKAAHNSLFNSYAEYYQFRVKGLRQASFESLRKFVDSLKAASIEQQRQVCIFCYELLEKGEAKQNLLPHQLSEVLGHILADWVESEKNDSRPFRWRGKFHNDYDSLQKAILVNPHDDQARLVFINRAVYGIWYSTHHLPDGYIGDYEEDLLREKDAIEHIQQLTDETLRSYWSKELDSEMILVRSYADWKASDTSSSFEQWAVANDRAYSSGVVAYYYTK